MMTLRRAFTLVELLVVVGIITLLVALLMPALTNARRQAVRVKCAAHLAQIGAAVTMYAGEHKGAIPMGYVYPAVGWPRGYHWPDHLAPYLQKQSGQDETAASSDRSVVWGCPAWDGRVEPEPSSYWGKPWNTGYGYNCLPLAPERGYATWDIMLTNRDIGFVGRYFKLCEIRHHSERGLVTDAHLAYVTVSYPWDPSAPTERQQYSSMSPTRHGRWGSAGSVNVLFFDGHVQAMSAKDAYFAFHDPMRTEVP
jgi:prepilin-type processing-associated H-X9-DG protein/prepilin-type N-terminal cleavage/methylation domain-containing protein